MVVVCGATEMSGVGDVKLMAAVKASSLAGPHRLVGTALDGVKVVAIGDLSQTVPVAITWTRCKSIDRWPTSSRGPRAATALPSRTRGRSLPGEVRSRDFSSNCVAAALRSTPMSFAAKDIHGSFSCMARPLLLLPRPENHKGQLGVGDEEMRNMPTLVEGPLKKEVVVHAATGKAHTVFITAKGQVFAAGDNKFGCVGPTPPKKKDTAPLPVLVPGIDGAVFAACGADFTMVLTSLGAVFSFGWSEYGQLGHGTDGSFNQSASSVKITYEAERAPKRVPGLGPVAQVACGPHHVCALQRDGVALTWGAGGYCRLGHNDQMDQWSPKALPNFLFKSVACGNT